MRLPASLRVSVVSIATSMLFTSNLAAATYYVADATTWIGRLKVSGTGWIEQRYTTGELDYDHLYNIYTRLRRLMPWSVVREVGSSNVTGETLLGTGLLPVEQEQCYYTYTWATRFVEGLVAEDLSDTQCHNAEPPPRAEIPDEYCPIVLDLDRDGLHLTSRESPVLFDINADGTNESIAWTASHDDDGLLCLDRNGNGMIDDGTELFGFATPLTSGENAVVGFEALRDLDSGAQGGNEDGVLDGRDEAFGQLCVWIDSNRNGVSESGEVKQLSETRVGGLGYSYRQTEIRDEFGNWFRYVGRSWFKNASGEFEETSWPVYDVLFAGQP